ncbi:methylated-DNA--[protein]-cysteine S-methyltransferase [Gulosibacter macacae]|uniref:Methylated-DNA--[protein]-cysteine S-methyltransferase n=1 Tax=Gulosibacter macacae TaxID=2488791 RepID=A0A3P3VUC0_9MICO|nr:methylated-DNA--[protein]-cysteine S-methyltransferase [Gulosibacter macacae]RRJ86401.1 methylated-DNA--[protein]-cysteine S-methyltransferase [Gulosibacter macacae]
MTTIATPHGPFSVLVDSQGTVLASGWTTDLDSLLALVHPTLRDDVGGDAAVALAAVDAYYAGDSSAPARVPVRQHSGEFRMHAWDVLRRVAPGAPVTYTEFAALADRPAATRAAAGACAMNAAALFVPCHRVVRSDGTLGGFRYGLDIKQALLEIERTRAA